MDQFFYQVTREQAEFEDLNAELQMLSDKEQNLVVEAAYSEYLQAMLAQCYEDQI